MQKRVFEVMGISAEDAEEKFGFLLEAFKFGPPPHGGIAFGWDRIVMLLAGEPSLRDVIAFPKTGGGFDPLTNAPAPITAGAAQGGRRGRETGEPARQGIAGAAPAGDLPAGASPTTSSGCSRSTRAPRTWSGCPAPRSSPPATWSRPTSPARRPTS